MNLIPKVPVPITRNRPAVFIFLVDISGSMKEMINWGGVMRSKAEFVAIVVNTMLAEIINRTKREDGYRDYAHIAVLGYGDNEVYSLVGDKAELKTTSELQAMTTNILKYDTKRMFPDGQQNTMTITTRQWIKPYAEGDTPMYKALQYAYKLSENYIQNTGVDALAPMIFNITDGEVSDATNDQLQDIALKIKSLHTNHGEALLCNIHISSNSENKSVLFPSVKRELGGNQYAALLFEMSSDMPAYFNSKIIELTGKPQAEVFKAMGFNISMIELLHMIEIGTVSTIRY